MKHDLPEWIQHMTRVPIAFVAPWLGMQLVGRAASSWCFGPCPACSAQRRHKARKDKRGAIGVSKGKPGGWRCMECQEGGTALDLVSWHIGGERYRDLTRERKADVRTWAERFMGVHDGAGSPTEPKYPGEVAVRTTMSVWCAETFLANTPERHYLETRGIDPERASRLAKPLLRSVVRPGWSRFGGRDWFDGGYTLILPLYDSQGRAQSVIARNVQGRVPKSVSPLGYGRSGLVMADGLGQQLLAAGKMPHWWPSREGLRVVIAEGEIDFLSWATQWGEGDAVSPVTFGIFSGGWSLAHAARIPDGSTVVLATHNDEAGDRYAHDLALTFANRDVQLERWQAPEVSNG